MEMTVYWIGPGFLEAPEGPGAKRRLIGTMMPNPTPPRISTANIPKNAASIGCWKRSN